MLLGSVRHKLTRNDAHFALQLLVRGNAGERNTLETSLREKGIDALLDDPRLATALLEQGEAFHSSLPLFTYVMVRRALREASIDERGFADFAASIVLHFGLQRRAHQIREHDDIKYDTLAELAIDAECGDPTRAFLARAHMGHFALWIAGLFPDAVEERYHRRGGPDLEYFDEMGKRGYQMAANHRLAAEHGVDSLFNAVAERFEVMRFALNRLSDTVFFPNHH